MKHLIIGIGIAIGLSFAALPAHAQSPKSIEITPLRTEVEGDPGTRYEGGLTIRNTGSQPRTITLSAEGFSVTNITYDYTFDSDVQATTWVKFSETSVTVSPSDSKTIPFSIIIPNGATAGGYYVSLFATATPSGSSGITISERLGSLLYITVNGDVSRTGKLLSLNTPSLFTQQGKWTATVQNNGNAHFRSVYSISTSTIWNQRLSTYEKSALILPNSIRQIGDDLPAPTFIGLYKANYLIGLGDQPAFHAERWFIYAPPLQTLITLASVVGVTLVSLRHRRIKHRH